MTLLRYACIYQLLYMILRQSCTIVYAQKLELVTCMYITCVSRDCHVTCAASEDTIKSTMKSMEDGIKMLKGEVKHHPKHQGKEDKFIEKMKVCVCVCVCVSLAVHMCRTNLPSPSLSLYLLYLSINLSIIYHLYIHVYLSIIYLSSIIYIFYVSIYLSLPLPLFLSIYLYLSIYLCIYLSISPSPSLSPGLPVHGRSNLWQAKRASDPNGEEIRRNCRLLCLRPKESSIGRVFR